MTFMSALVFSFISLNIPSASGLGRYFSVPRLDRELALVLNHTSL